MLMLLPCPPCLPCLQYNGSLYLLAPAASAAAAASSAAQLANYVSLSRVSEALGRPTVEPVVAAPAWMASRGALQRQLYCGYWQVLDSAVRSSISWHCLHIALLAALAFAWAR